MVRYLEFIISSWGETVSFFHNALVLHYKDVVVDNENADREVVAATLDKLRACGISVSKQKAPPLPTNVRLPPGISLSGSADSGPKRCSVSSNRDSANKKVALDHNVASAITAVGNTSNEPKQKVELELSDKQMNALRALGLL